MLDINLVSLLKVLLNYRISIIFNLKHLNNLKLIFILSQMIINLKDMIKSLSNVKFPIQIV